MSVQYVCSANIKHMDRKWNTKTVGITDASKKGGEKWEWEKDAHGFQFGIKVFFLRKTIWNIGKLIKQLESD